MDPVLQRAELAALRTRAAVVPEPPLVLDGWVSLVAEEYALAVLRLRTALAGMREAIAAAEAAVR
ncbi:hypothetical protein QDR37_06800 [Amnibacterium sp. CER49]|uniref:hypothetical protein n=1 Tax=Amnibacterium sp. CER49 TaxID=3039161 RepID=UPI00244BB3A5|nr:hypothetical protein [Amnibacterium sp. CER49]MDH2443648.1 hypothetical protein [Amnibacterium sp. CER49]